MALFDQFKEFLIEVCIDDGTTTYVDAILVDAKAAISGGKGVVSSLTSSGVNGKTFSRAVNLSPIEVARACQMALAIYGDTETEIGSTYADFSSLQR